MAKLKIIFITALFITNFANAHIPAEGTISAQFGLLATKTEAYGLAENEKNPLYGGIGFLAIGDLHETGSLEVGIFHTQKTYFRQLGTDTLSEKTEVLHIGIGYRHWLSSVFSSSLSFTSSYSMGESQQLFYQGATPQALDTSARDTTDYGLDFALQAELLQISNLTLTSELRYNYSLTEKIHEQSNHYMAMLGVKYIVQEKNQK